MVTSEILVVDAILFDMDGTLIDSTPGVLKAWETFSRDYNLGDSRKIAHETHGRRLYDTLREYCRVDDEEQLNAEIDRFEDEVIEGGTAALSGAIPLIDKLLSECPDRWTIVTSASSRYAFRALEHVEIALPPSGIITSNDVAQGKPHPAPYLAGAARCRIDPSKCKYLTTQSLLRSMTRCSTRIDFAPGLVVEDAIAGIKSGNAAGARTLAVCTSTPRATIASSDAHPTYIVNDLTRVSVRSVANGVEVTIDLID